MFPKKNFPKKKVPETKFPEKILSEKKFSKNKISWIFPPEIFVLKFFKKSGPEGPHCLQLLAAALRRS